MLRRLGRMAVAIVAALLALMISGLFVADLLSPPSTGEPSRALPLRDDQTAIDRDLVPLLAERPGQSGAVMLVDGMDAFAARAALTRQAGRSLDIQYYIWRDDLVGHLLLYELWQAAERGVRVRLLLDDINTAGRDVALLALAHHPNIEVRVYNPFRNRSGLRRVLEMIQRAWSVNYRMHNKAWTADGRATIVGGRNVGNEYFSAATETNFRDLDLLVLGPAVSAAEQIFDAFWNDPVVVPITALKQRDDARLQGTLATIRDEARSDLARTYLQQVAESASVRRFLSRDVAMHWSASLRILSDPPDKRSGGDQAQWLYRKVLADLAAAEHEALLISPYFVPGIDGSAQLVERLPRDRVKVAVVTNSLVANDVLAVHSGYRRYRPGLLESGVGLFEIRGEVDGESSLFGSSGASLHTKAYLIDQRRGFIGSFNMDPRSAYLNTEMGVVFDDPGLAAELGAEFWLLASPAFSYQPFLNERGAVHWRDRTESGDRVLAREPDSRWWQRWLVVLLGWLPIESQL